MAHGIYSDNKSKGEFALMSVIEDALINFGLDVLDIVPDGRIRRCRSRAKDKKNKDGWYVVKEFNGHLYCYYGCWIRGTTGKVSDNENHIKQSETWKDLAQIAKYEEDDRREKGTIKATDFWKKCQQINDNKCHEYLIKKNIQPSGAKISNGMVITPVIQPNGEISSYQSISRDGVKKFMTGGVVKGGAMPIGQHRNGNPILICEGFATGATLHQASGYFVLVAYNKGNLRPVCESAISKYQESDIIICADNDHSKTDNPGLTEAKKISSDLDIECLWPTGISGSDFNDMASETGIDAVTSVLINRKVIVPYDCEKKRTNRKYSFLDMWMPNVMQDIVNYYHDTAIKPQPLFGVATALILGSVILGRRYKTDFDNYSSCYFLLVAKSGTGKDHPKNIIRRILNECHLGWLERSGGYTSSSSVMKSLEKQPLQVTFFEEFGQRLKEASNSNRAMAATVFRQLLDIWSSCHSVSVGDEYVDGTTPRVERPALTTIGVTTPKQLFDSVTENLIEQGFMNRFIPFISDEDMVATPLKKTAKKDIPVSIIEWVYRMWPWAEGRIGSIIEPEEEFKKNPCADEPMRHRDFTDESIELLNVFEQEVVIKSKELSKKNINDMLSRNREMVMRIALIIAMFDESECIERRHVEWAWVFVEESFDIYISDIRHKLSGSDFEAMKMDGLNDLRSRGKDGLKPSLMPKTSPWSRWEKRQRMEILTELQEAGLADMVKIRTGKRGPGTTVWVALE